MAGNNSVLLRLHPSLNQGPQKRPSTFLTRVWQQGLVQGTAAGDTELAVWKQVNLMNPKGLALDRNVCAEIRPVGPMQHRRQVCREERLIVSTSLSCGGSTLLPGGPGESQEAARTATQPAVTVAPWLWTGTWDFQDEVKLCWFYIRNGIVPGMSSIYTGRTQGRTNRIKVLAC